MSVWGARIEHVLTDYFVLGGVSACDEVANFQVGPLLPRHSKPQDGLCTRVFGLQIVWTKAKVFARCAFVEDRSAKKRNRNREGLENRF